MGRRVVKKGSNPIRSFSFVQLFRRHAAFYGAAECSSTRMVDSEKVRLSEQGISQAEG
jgi:hypothetical protein